MTDLETNLRRPFLPHVTNALIVGAGVTAFSSTVAVLFAAVASIPHPLTLKIAIGLAAIAMSFCPLLALMLLITTRSSTITRFDYAVTIGTSLSAIFLLHWIFAEVLQAISGSTLSLSGSTVLVVGCSVFVLIGGVEIWRRVG